MAGCVVISITTKFDVCVHTVLCVCTCINVILPHVLWLIN